VPRTAYPVLLQGSHRPIGQHGPMSRCFTDEALGGSPAKSKLAPAAPPKATGASYGPVGSSKHQITIGHQRP
jgi:hypothetical protein